MTRRPSGGPGRSALYTWSRERAEAAAMHPLATPGNRERLAALRAGCPVDVRIGELPEWARRGEVLRWWRRATVTTTGAVEFYDDDGEKWLTENGL